MKKPLNRAVALSRPGASTGRNRVALRRVAYWTTAAALVAFLLLPYVTIWRMDRAAQSEEPARLAELVDLDAVRSEIKKKLNKDAASTIDTLSDPFLRWLDAGIQSRGNRAVEELVTLAWIREQLLAQEPGGAEGGFLGRITYAFFDAPTGFRVRVGSPEENPLHLRMRLRGLSWRVEALYR